MREVRDWDRDLFATVVGHPALGVPGAWHELMRRPIEVPDRITRTARLPIL